VVEFSPNKSVEPRKGALQHRGDLGTLKSASTFTTLPRAAPPHKALAPLKNWYSKPMSFALSLRRMPEIPH
jgi:hypothetical protein